MTQSVEPARRSPAIPARRRSRALEAALRSGPFELALHLAIAESGLSLESLRRRLGAEGIRIGLSTLSYWQRGVRRPERAESLRALHAIEDLLGLSRASLVALLGPPRPRGRWCEGKDRLLDFEDTVGRQRTMSTVLTGLDAAVNSKVEHLSMHGERWMRADRSWRVDRVRRVVAAPAEGVDRYIAIYVPDAAEERPPAIVPLYGCRLGRVRTDPETGFHAAELLFDTRLRAGQTHVFDYEYRAAGSSGQVNEYYHGSRQPLRELVLLAHFDPAAVPVRSYHFRRRRHDDQQRDLAEIAPGRDWSVQVVSLDCRPGIEGVRWEWE